MNLQPKSSEMEKLTCLSLWEWFPRLLQVHFRTLYYFFCPWPQPDLHTHRANIMENYRWYSLNSLEYGIAKRYPCKNTPVSLLYSHHLCIHPDLGTTAWVVMSGSKSNKYSCMRASQLQRTSRLIIATSEFLQFWNKSMAKQNKQGLDKTKNAVALVLLSCLWKQPSATSRANLNRLGRKPVLDLVSAPLTRRLKAICQESLVQSRRNKFLFPYSISSEEFQSRGIDRSQLLASSDQINCQVHIWSLNRFVKLRHPSESW